MPDQPKERPILFNAEMVRAVLAGRKTQTRRVVKLPDSCGFATYFHPTEYTFSHWDRGYEEDVATVPCPYGVPGDRLWVREAWGASARKPSEGDRIWYRADNDRPTWAGDRWRPSIHMPRWASRILLEVTDVRVERVQEISEGDAVAEGVMPNWPLDPDEWLAESHGYMPYCTHHPEPCDCHEAANAVDSFRGLWNSINANRGFAWSDNPWVWAVAFKVLEGGAADA